MKKVVLLVLLVASLSFSSFLNYWVDPFFGSYGFSIRQDVNFWKINALLRYDLSVSWKQGFAFVFPNYPYIAFELQSEQYLAQFGYSHKNIPFSIHVNPVSYGLNIKWGFVGFYNDYQYFSSEIFDMIVSSNFYNLSLKWKNNKIFLEKFAEEFAFGAVLKGFILYKKNESINIGLNINSDNYIIYFLPFEQKMGFVLENDNNYLYLTENMAVFSMKWNDIFFSGEFQSEKKTFRIEFPIF